MSPNTLLPDTSSTGALKKETYTQAESEDNESFTEYIPKPPDGGWGWVIVFASFVGNMIVDSIASTFGILLPEIQRYFGTSKAATSLIGSLQGACMLTAGPIVSGLVNKFGTRPVSVFGAILATTATFLSSWATSNTMLVISYGIVSGIGLCMVWLPSVIQVGYYFEKKRAVAVGMAVAGSGIGTFLFAPLITFAMELYGWKGSLWIIAGIIMQGIVTGCLLRPLRAKKNIQHLDSKLRVEAVKILESITEYQPEKACPLAEEWQKKAHGELQNISEDRSLAPFFLQLEHQFSDAEKAENADELLHDIREEIELQNFDGHGSVEFGAIPFEKEPAFQPELETIEEHAVFEPTEDPPVCETVTEINEEEEGLMESPGREDLGEMDDEDDLDDESASIVTSVGVGTSISSINSVLTDRTEGTGTGPAFVRRRLNQTQPEPPNRSKLSARYFARSLQRLRGMNPLAAAHSLGTISSVDLQDFSKPMYKKDIFYSGSIQNIANADFNTEGDYGKFRESTISIPRTNLPGKTREKKLKPRPVLKTFGKPLAFPLDRFMKIFSAAGAITILSYFTPWIYLGSHARELGYSAEASALLLSLIGITNAVGRIFFGWLADRNWIQTIHILNLAVTLTAICTCFVPYYTSYHLLALYAVFYGFLSASFVTLTTVIIVDYMGLEKLTNSFGLVLLFRGVAVGMGSPISAFLYDYSGSYGLSFSCAGGTQLFATLISASIPFLCTRVDKKKST